MKRINGCIAILLSITLVALTACGSKAGSNTNEREVEVDLDNIQYSDDTQVSSRPKIMGVPVVSTAPPVEHSEENDFYDENDDSGESEEVSSYTVSAAPRKKKSAVDLKPGLEASPEWFEDCVFMGDSLTNGLGMYNDMTGVFGNAEFICSAGLGWCNSQWSMDDPNEVHPIYNGQKVFLYDAVTLTGANKAIIGMGMNDVGIYGVEATLDYAKEFLDKVRVANPDVQIYLQTISPMIAQAEYTALNNPLIQQYDEALEIFAREQNCKFINSWEYLADESGKLPYELCSDPDLLGLHLTTEGCEIWADCILHSVY